MHSLLCSRSIGEHRQHIRKLSKQKGQLPLTDILQGAFDILVFKSALEETKKAMPIKSISGLL